MDGREGGEEKSALSAWLDNDDIYHKVRLIEWIPLTLFDWVTFGWASCNIDTFVPNV